MKVIGFGLKTNTMQVTAKPVDNRTTSKKVFDNIDKIMFRKKTTHDTFHSHSSTAAKVVKASIKNEKSAIQSLVKNVKKLHK